MTDAPEHGGDAGPALDQVAADSRRRTWWRLGVGAAVAGAVGLGIGISAASASDAPAPNAIAVAQPADEPADKDTDKDADRPGPWRGWWGGGGGPWAGAWGGMGVQDMLHSEVVKAKEGGGTETVLVQKGVATAVSPTSITVRSDDGFTKTYAVSADTKVNGGSAGIETVAKEEKVLVSAPQTGGNLTATTLVDLTDLGCE